MSASENMAGGLAKAGQGEGTLLPVRAGYADSQDGLVRDQLGKILATEAFVRSPRLSRFLTYIVDRALQGRVQELHEYSIGVDVFDRGTDFDPRLESVVRVEARRLRQLLRGYYDSDGRDDAVRIDMPTGGYTPILHVPGAVRKASPHLELLPPDPHFATVAVLAFADLSPDRSEEYFCEGLAEQLTDTLHAAGWLKVIARTSALAFKHKSQDIREIARTLGAGWLIEGSVRKCAENRRVSVRLVEAQDGCHVWTHTHKQDDKDVFSIQDEICRIVLQAAEFYVHRRRNGTGVISRPGKK